MPKRSPCQRPPTCWARRTSWGFRRMGAAPTARSMTTAFSRKNVNQDRRIVVIDLPSQSLTRVIDLGEIRAPRGVMIDASGAVWSSGELANAVFVIDPAGDTVQLIDVGNTAHWLVDQPSRRPSLRLGQDGFRRRHRRRHPRRDRPDQSGADDRGARLFAGRCPPLCLGKKRRLIGGTDPAKIQMRRVRVSPDNRYIVASVHQESHAAVYAVDGLRPLVSSAANKGPVGFGFAADGQHAYLCCDDDAMVVEFELASGRATRTFPTAAGCEFIVAYH
jgi:hypothetical protein